MKYHLDLQSCWKAGLQRVGPKDSYEAEWSPRRDAYGKRGGLVLIMKLDIEKACNK